MIALIAVSIVKQASSLVIHKRCAHLVLLAKLVSQVLPIVFNVVVENMKSTMRVFPVRLVNSAVVLDLLLVRRAHKENSLIWETPPALYVPLERILLQAGLQLV